MKINLTKKQYIDFVTAISVANSVFGILGDYISNKLYKKQSDDMREFENYLLNFAKDFDCENLIEYWENETIMSNEADKKFQKIIDEYDDFVFWSELETRMGKRDFGRTITDEEKQYIEENDGWFPERIDTLYKKYRKEFEKHGIERLRIKKTKQELKE